MIKKGEESAVKARAEAQVDPPFRVATTHPLTHSHTGASCDRINMLLRQGKERPKKRLYRARAHSNPLNDAHFPVPSSPEAVDWCAGLQISTGRHILVTA